MSDPHHHRTSDEHHLPVWDRVAAELRSCREQQERTWGNVDSATLGRYLDGATDPVERQKVESALAAHPELRKLTDLVREVLADFEPAAGPAPVTVPAPAPAVLAFTPRPRQRSWLPARQYLALAAAACLLLALGVGLFRAGTRESAPRGDEVVVALAGGTASRTSAGQDGPLASALPTPPSEPAVAPLYKLAVKANVLAREGKVNDAVRVASEIPEVARKKNLEEHPYFGTTMAQVGDLYLRNGYLPQAAGAYHQAYEVVRGKLGDDSPYTQQALTGYAEVCQRALNATEYTRASGSFKIDPQTKAAVMGLAPGATAPEPPALPAARLHVEADRKDAERERCSALQLREQITRREPARIRREVVPLLVRAFRSARNPGERAGCMYALAQIGPAAQDAIPDLLQCVRKPPSDSERQAALLALGEIGPANPDAIIPELLKQYREGDPKLRESLGLTLVGLGTRGVAALDREARSAIENEPPAYVILLTRARNQLRKEKAAGVCDGGQLFTPYTLHRVRAELAALARQRLPLFIETEAQPPQSPLTVAERTRLLETPGVYVLLVQHPQRVEVHVADALKQRLDPEALRQRIETVWKNKGPDAALQQTVAAVAALKGNE